MHYPFCVIPKHLESLEDFDSDDFQIALDNYDLTWVVGYLNHNNISGRIPYHNNQHMYGVAVVADYLYHKETAGDFCQAEHMQLLVASLMHDFMHSGGAVPDYANVRKAIEIIPYLFVKGAVSVQRMIAITEYPFKHDPVSTAEKCLRDADLLYATLSNDPTIIMEGLRREIIAARGEEITLQQMAVGQREFMSNVVLFTTEGQRLFDRFTPAYLDSLQQYADSN